MLPYKPSQDLSAYSTLLHGDLSGIQEFIFNIQSEGAAKTLKARSFYVQALSELCLDLIEETLPEGNCLLYYNGGGNFYIFCKTLSDADLKTIRRNVQEYLADTNIYLNLSKTDLHIDQFGPKTWANIHRQANADKLRKFAEYPEAFLPRQAQTGTDDWKDFVKPLTKHEGYDIQPGRSNKVAATSLSAFHRTLRLSNKNHQFKNSIQNKLPQWDDTLLEVHREYAEKLHERNLKKDPSSNKLKRDDILEFETLGYFAKTRTGTDNIAMLKMDVDDLGMLFQHASDINRTKEISDALTQFFDQKLLDLWINPDGFQYLDSKGETHQALFSQNIYIVFSGGDDCMMIGAWDAICEFALLVHDAFAAFAPLQQLQLDKMPTLSASITIVDKKFPVVRMGDMAQNALDGAKYAVSGEKNKVSVLGNILRWDEYRRARELAHDLELSIKKDKEKRSILNRVQVSHIGFDKLVQRAIDRGEIHNPAVWRLLYFLRNSRSIKKLENIINDYQNALFEAVVSKKRINGAAMLPVAARWAELLTR